MISVVWRANGGNFPVDDFLGRFPSLEPDAFWRVAEPRPVGGAHTSSGFNASLAQAPEWAEAWRLASAALARHEPASRALRELGVGMSLDIGVFVDVQRHPKACARLEPDQLAHLSRLGIGLDFSAYACAPGD